LGDQIHREFFHSFESGTRGKDAPVKGSTHNMVRFTG